MCLLTGPAGCGKTATIRALSHDMKFEVLEWTNPMSRSSVGSPYSITGGQQIEQDEYHYYYEPSQTKQFCDFLNRANRYPSLVLDRNPTNDMKEKKIVLVEVCSVEWP